MHELKITKTIIDMILDECASRKIAHPKTVVVEVGEFTSYKPEPILFYFDLLKKEKHLLQSMSMEVVEKKGIIACKKCKSREAMNDMMLLCKKCGSPNVDIVEGNDVKIVSMGFEDVMG